MSTALLMFFVILAKGHSHSLFWVTLIPPISFFLLGIKWGTVISGVCFGICIFLVYQQTLSIEPAKFGTGALFNVIEVCIAQVFLFRFYERSRSSAYRQLSMRNQEVLALSETDKLTKLFNRDKLDAALITITKHSAIHKQPLSAILLDIDRFKQINDEHGHLIGDTVLSELASELSNMMRKNDFLARWGGEEFMILLQNTKIDIAWELAERLRKQVLIKTFGGQSITVSIGVGLYRAPESSNKFFDRIDAGLYQAKRNGRNRTVSVDEH